MNDPSAALQEAIAQTNQLVSQAHPQTPDEIEEAAEQLANKLEINERAREILAGRRSAKTGKKSLREMLLSSADLDDIEDPEPLVEGLFDRDSTARVTGKSNAGKSFIMTDIACCIAAGSDWHGSRTESGPVVYVVAEGARGFKKRVRAWEQRYNEGRRLDNLHTLPYAVQVLNTDEWNELITVCEEIKPELIVLDTQARITTGIQENDATDMGRLVDACERLRVATGACVTLVHHLGHNGDQGRGSTAVMGAINSEITVSQDARSGVIEVKTNKQKDSVKAGAMKFKLEDQSAGYSLRTGSFAGLPVTSAVLVPVQGEVNVAVNQDPDAPDAWMLFPVPAEITQYTGRGAKLIPLMARFMAHSQEGDAVNIGLTQAQVFEALGAVKPKKGDSDLRPTARNAWSWLIGEHYIVPSPNIARASSDTGRHVWAAGIHEIA